MTITTLSPHPFQPLCCEFRIQGWVAILLAEALFHHGGSPQEDTLPHSLRTGRDSRSLLLKPLLWVQQKGAYLLDRNDGTLETASSAG